MNQKLKKVLLIAAAAVTLAVGVLWIFGSGLKHIEDTNGPDSYTLTTINDGDIIKNEMGALTPVTVREALIGDAMHFESKKFTGVHEVLYNNYVLPSDVVFSINTLSVTEGNFRMVVVHEGKIIAEIRPNSEELIQEVRLENVTGYVSLRIAGESAAYSFQMSPLDFEGFVCPDAP